MFHPYLNVPPSPPPDPTPDPPFFPDPPPKYEPLLHTTVLSTRDTLLLRQPLPPYPHPSNPLLYPPTPAPETPPVLKPPFKPPAPTRSPKRRQKRSIVWRFFDECDDPNAAICRLCKQRVPRGRNMARNTTNLRKHLEHRHKKFFKPPTTLLQPSFASDDAHHHPVSPQSSSQVASVQAMGGPLIQDDDHHNQYPHTYHTHQSHPSHQQQQQQLLPNIMQQQQQQQQHKVSNPLAFAQSMYDPVVPDCANTAVTVREETHVSGVERTELVPPSLPYSTAPFLNNYAGLNGLTVQSSGGDRVRQVGELRGDKAFLNEFFLGRRNDVRREEDIMDDRVSDMTRLWGR